MSNRFPWYDSSWLEQFVRAKEFIAVHHADRLPEFLDAIAPLRTRDDFRVSRLDDVLTDDVMSKIKNVVMTLKPSDLETYEMMSFGRWIVHDHPLLTEIQHTTTALVSEAAGEEVEPCYNFLSMYTKLGRCAVHMDAPSAKWTLDICLDQSEIWPIHFSQIVPWPDDDRYAGEDWPQRIVTDPAIQFSTFEMQPGQALLFSGSSQWHYRDPLAPKGPQAFCTLLFFHFIPKGMSAVVDPHNWPALFGIPALAEIVRV